MSQHIIHSGYPVSLCGRRTLHANSRPQEEGVQEVTCRHCLAVYGEQDDVERAFGVTRVGITDAERRFTRLERQVQLWVNNLREAMGPKQQYTSPTAEAIIGAAIDRLQHCTNYHKERAP